LVEERQEVALLVFVAGGDPDFEGEPVCVYGEVETAARLATDRARDLLAPLLASTVEASTITRDQSSFPCSLNWSCSKTSASVNAPRCCHSSSLRLHVSPLGKPSSR
jgi:hypothetical protein